MSVVTFHATRCASVADQTPGLTEMVLIGRISERYVPDPAGIVTKVPLDRLLLHRDVWTSFANAAVPGGSAAPGCLFW